MFIEYLQSYYLDLVVDLLIYGSKCISEQNICSNAHVLKPKGPVILSLCCTFNTARNIYRHFTDQCQHSYMSVNVKFFLNV